MLISVPSVLSIIPLLIWTSFSAIILEPTDNILSGSAVTTTELPIDNAPVVGTCKAPSESIVNLWVPSVKNFNWSLSELGAFSAVM